MTSRLSPAAWLSTAVLGVVLACGDSGLLRIDLDDSVRTTVPAATPVEVVLGGLGFGDLVAMDLTEAEELRNQGVEPGDITTAFLMDFTLSVVSPEGEDLSFIDTMALYVEAPGLERKLVAEAADFEAASVSFDLTDVDLADYIVSESMTLSTEVDARRPSRETVLKADYVIEVGVTAQGARKACN